MNKLEDKVSALRMAGIKLGLDVVVNVEDIQSGVEKLTIPEGVGVVRRLDDAWKEYKIKTLVLPSTLKRIEREAFMSYVELESVICKEGLENIGPMAFNRCKKLSNIELPDSIEIIDELAFLDCPLTDNIKLPKQLRVLGNQAFSGNKAISIDVNSCAINRISNGAFFNCRNLKSVRNIPDNVDELGESCFYGCESLAEIELPKGLKVIDSRCFTRCALTKVDLSETEVKSIKSSAYSDCKYLETVILSESIENIAENAFSGCRKLKALDFSKSKLLKLGKILKMVNTNWSQELMEIIVNKETIEEDELLTFQKVGFHIVRR